MQDTILEKIGIDPAYLFLLIILLIAVLFAMVINLNMKHARLKRKYNLFMRGQDGESLEKSLLGHVKKMEEIEILSEENQIELGSIKQKLSKSYQKTGFVRYDAFHEMGGNLSFAFAMLDGDDNGWILNAMHSREGCYMYMKEIVNGECQLELAEEEAEALDRAIYQEQTNLEEKNS